MKSSGETSNKTSTAKKSLSKPKEIKLKPYEFDPKDLNKLIEEHAKVDPKKDMKAAKKSRTLIKKKIAEIKRVNASNKKDILEFKRNMEAYDLAKFELLTSGLSTLFNTLDKQIKDIEDGAALRKAEVDTSITSLSNTFTNKILDAKSTEEIQAVQVEINHITATQNEYDDRVGDVESLKTSLILKASGRATEIQNAGGTIKDQAVEPIDPNPIGDMGRRVSDTDLINFLQNSGSAKGWVVNISPTTGVQVYQVDDPTAPRDLRVALENAHDQHQGM